MALCSSVARKPRRRRVNGCGKRKHPVAKCAGMKGPLKLGGSVVDDVEADLHQFEYAWLG